MVSATKHFHFLFRTIVFLSILLLIKCTDDSTSSDISAHQYVIPVTTNDGWQTASLSEVGLNEDLLIELTDRISAGFFDHIHSVVIIKDDKLVFEEYWTGNDFGYLRPDYLGTSIDYDMNTRQNTHSATKSVVSALVGIAINKGFIQSENDIIFDYLDSSYGAWKNEGRENITIKDCLMMASGLEWNEWDVSVSNSEHDLIRFNQSTFPVRYLLGKPLLTEPGTSFYYNGGTVDLLGVIVANATGQSIPDFSRDYLFAPMGITNYNWQTLRPSGITCCHGDIYITPRDLAKFGYLYLNEGNWNGEQLIPQEWVESSTQNKISPGVNWPDGYGYLWWRKNFNANGRIYESFKAMGWGGQEIIVINELNIVIVFTGSNYVTNAPCDEMVEEFILPAIQ